jgi:hypothetical protein
MQPAKEKPARGPDDEGSDESGYNELLFFDFECRQEDCTHKPNLCVIQNKAGDE